MIKPELASFLEEGLGIHVGTRDERLRPNGARALAVKVSPDGAHIVVYLSQVAAGRVLPDLESNGQAAVDFGRPTDDRACQVKGLFVSSWAASAEERALIETQWRGYGDKLEGIGIPRAAFGNWTIWPAVAIRLKATALFEQTPGPQAGVPLA